MLNFKSVFSSYNETTMNGQDCYLRIHDCDHPDITILLYSGHLFRIILWYPTNTPINLIHNRFSSFLCYMKWTKIITNKSNDNKKPENRCKKLSKNFLFNQYYLVIIMDKFILAISKNQLKVFIFLPSLFWYIISLLGGNQNVVRIICYNVTIVSMKKND